MFSRSPLDWGLVVVFCGFLVALWARRLGRPTAAADYLVAGRRVTLPAFVATLVATWYGGILGVGEYSWRHGVSNWLVFGLPYYVGALLFAWLFARRAREAALYTLPDLLARHYGRGPALMGALAVFVTSAPAAYVLMLGTLLAAMLGLPLVPCVLGAALVSVLYVHSGGLRNAVLADQVFFILMYAGFAVLLAFLVTGHGGAEFLRRSVPAAHFTWHGGNPPGAILVWYFIALSALVDPAFWQSAYAARDPKVARRGVLIAVAFWMVFDFMTTTAGLYARALLPTLDDPVFAFPELAKRVLPAGALGLFYLGLIATVMSTIDSYAFIAATTLARDVAWRLRPQLGEERLPALTRAGLWVAGAFAAALALARPSVVALWRDLGSITTPALLLPVATALLGRGRLAPRPTLAAMAIPFLVSLAWVLAGRAPSPGAPARYPLAIEPIYAGLAASLAIYAAGWAAGGLRRPETPAPAALEGDRIA
jgi:SSS family solute:Na+ symporter